MYNIYNINTNSEVTFNFYTILNVNLKRFLTSLVFWNAIDGIKLLSFVAEKCSRKHAATIC